MPHKVIVLEGYHAYPGRRRRRAKRRSSGGRSAHKARFKKAAKACKGMGRGVAAYRACVARKMKR